MSWDINLKSLYEVQCFRDGSLLWEESVYNLITTVGKNALLDRTFFSGLVTPTWYVGLVDTTSFSQFAATDTMSSHSGWIENDDYDEAARPAYTVVAASSGSMSNDASRALFSMNAIADIKGAFLTTVSTKNGTTGILYGEAAFGTSRNVVSGDVLSIKITLTD